MRNYIFLLPVLFFLFTSCSKESKCVKGELIGYNPCNRSWGVQITNGPHIGTNYGSYDNVIELFDAPADKKIGAIVYFSYKKRERRSSERPCIAILPNPDYSNVEMSLVSWSQMECPK